MLSVSESGNVAGESPGASKYDEAAFPAASLNLPEALQVGGCHAVRAAVTIQLKRYGMRSAYSLSCGGKAWNHAVRTVS